MQSAGWWRWVVVLGLTVLTGCTKPKPAPDFAFTTLGGDEMLFSSYQGEPVVLNFWSPDSAPCVAELPRFQDAYTKYQGRFELLVLSSKGDGVQSYVSEKGFNMTFGVEHGGKSGLGSGVLPRTLFVDRQGNISSDHIGEITAAEFEADLQRIL